jgi:SAM-dependent methyltransferase
MLGLALVRPLEDEWRDVLDAVARRRGWPTSHDVARLGSCVAALSEAYNDPTRARATMGDAGAGRLGFAFARDVPKAAAAVRELVAGGALRLDSTLRVLDVGAGLGAMTWGLLRALEASGACGSIDATWTDTDTHALDVGRALVEGLRGRGRIEIRLRTIAASLDEIPKGQFDVVLLGNVLSELDVGLDAHERVERHAALLGSLLDRRLDGRGSLVVVEPALRERSRHLHRVRDRVVSSGATIFAPCLHMDPCPALARESEWCHEDLPVDLPRWLVPVARVAGLRRQGLTFSYLVLRKDGVRIVDSMPERSGGARLRVVSDAIASKGKLESFLCGKIGSGEGLAAVRARVTRLHRDESTKNAEWKRLRRGDLIVLHPAPDRERHRVGPETSVSISSEDIESR